MSTFSTKLVRWYSKNARDLPWRRSKDPYKIWISEIMLQQTTVNTVTAYFERWVRLFPTVAAVAKAPLQKVLKAWEGLGYYTRARNIHASAKIIQKQYGGRIPEDPVALKALPGLGPYTVGAVLSIAFDQRQPIIDANVRRVVMRQLARQGFADTSHDSAILPFLDKVMPQRGNNIFNQALMELGALVCRNKEPLCLICPVQDSCRAYRKGIQEIIPTPKKKILKNIAVAIGIIKWQDKYFIQKRPAQGLLADLWEFPGGKIEPGETAQQALVRELKEEIQVDVQTATSLMEVTHFYTEFRVKLHVFNCQVSSTPRLDATHKLVKSKELAKYPMPSGSAKIVARLLNQNN